MTLIYGLQNAYWVSRHQNTDPVAHLHQSSQVTRCIVNKH